MPHIARTYRSYYGTSAGNGHCVALVRECSGLPHTSAWRRGDPVQGAALAPGTAIATFDGAGRYPNSMTGDSHAAILLATHEDGSITVADQWLMHNAAERVVRNRQGRGKAINDASRFYVIELQDDGDG